MMGCAFRNVADESGMGLLLRISRKMGRSVSEISVRWTSSAEGMFPANLSRKIGLICQPTPDQKPHPCI